MKQNTNGILLRTKQFVAVILVVLIAFFSLGCSSTSKNTNATSNTTTTQQSTTSSVTVNEDGQYTSKAEVAAYIHTYGKLPSNYITKTKAQKAGWDAQSGNLQKVCPGKSIGGGRFYNDEGILPDKSGRVWYECDIDYTGGTRNAKRIVYSNDGLIYYTEDHYKTFERLY